MSSESGQPSRSVPLGQGRFTDAPSIRRIDVQDLLGHDRELILVLQGSEYRLRLTSKGKLILTK